MNRSLMIPAVCSLFTFATLWATLGGATGGDTVPRPARLETVCDRGDRESMRLARASGATAAQADGIPPLSVAEAKDMLTRVTSEYVQPWQKLESSPHRLYSRARPHHIPPISATVEPLLVSTDHSASFLLASVTVKKGKQTQQIPCVVDRLNRRTRFFAEGRWLTEDEWLKTAPLP